MAGRTYVSPGRAKSALCQMFAVQVNRNPKAAERRGLRVRGSCVEYSGFTSKKENIDE